MALISDILIQGLPYQSYYTFKVPIRYQGLVRCMTRASPCWSEPSKTASYCLVLPDTRVCTSLYQPLLSEFRQYCDTKWEKGGGSCLGKGMYAAPYQTGNLKVMERVPGLRTLFLFDWNLSHYLHNMMNTILFFKQKDALIKDGRRLL